MIAFIRPYCLYSRLILNQMLRHKADIRTLLYMVVTTLIFAYQWHVGFADFGVWNLLLYIVYLHFAVAVSVMTHNHNHLPVWHNKTFNLLTDWWLTVFYGIPIFTWIPTHNSNHHRYTNKEGDSTATYRKTELNNLFTFVSYPGMSSYFQITEGIIPFMKELKKKDNQRYWQYLTQCFVLVAWWVFWFAIDWQKAIVFVIIPQQVSGYIVQIFNYVQHVHADEESDFNHSRNFMGVNLFLFNNGYHTVHHLKAGMHWSETPKYHAQVVDKINPELIEKSFWGYVIRTYVISAIWPKYRSKSMRLERIARKQESKPSPELSTAEA